MTRRTLLSLMACPRTLALALGASAWLVLTGCATQPAPTLAPATPLVLAPATPVTPTVAPQPTPPPVPMPVAVTPPEVLVVPPPPAIPPAEPLPPEPTPLQFSGKRAWQPRTYAVYYGPWRSGHVQQAQAFDLVIFHPGDDFDNLTQAQVQAVRRPDAQGVPKTRMVAYITIGEDDSPLAPPNTTDDRHGPVRWENNQLIMTEKGYPARYVDQDKNGKPDENGAWHSRFINVGDATWQTMVITRMQQIEQSFGPLDGFFLDTVDTAAADGPYPWLQRPMLDFLGKLRATFPKAYLIANRGMTLIQYDAAHFRNAINGLMYENLVTEWDDKRKVGIVSPDIVDNVDFLRKVVAPEIRRPDGFDLLVLDYAVPTQAGYASLVHLQREVLTDLPHTRYLSSIDLEGFFPAPPNYGPRPTEPLPVMMDVQVSHPAGRLFQVDLSLAHLGSWQLGSDLLAEVVFLKPGQEVLAGVRVLVVGNQLSVDPTTGKVRLKVLAPKDIKYNQLQLRFITAKAAYETPWSSHPLPQ